MTKEEIESKIAELELKWSDNARADNYSTMRMISEEIDKLKEQLKSLN